MEYLINLGMLVATPLLVLTVSLLVLTTFKDSLPETLNKHKCKGYFALISLIMVWGGLQPSITYKHTTDYNKEQDVYNIERQQGDVELNPIVDKTLKPKTTDETRKQSFEESIKYN